MTTHSQPPAEPDAHPDRDPGGPPTDVSKPIGDAIPAPVEPGLDQPLPEKDANAAPDPLGDTDTPPGVPEPGPSDFA